MASLDRLLRDDLNRLIDRMAAAHGEGQEGGMTDLEPGLRRMMDEAEGRLSALRLHLLAEYEDWRRAMDACESLWALARLRGGEIPLAEDTPESEALRAA